MVNLEQHDLELTMNDRQFDHGRPGLNDHQFDHSEMINPGQHALEIKL